MKKTKRIGAILLIIVTLNGCVNIFDVNNDSTSLNNQIDTTYSSQTDLQSETTEIIVQDPIDLQIECGQCFSANDEGYNIIKSKLKNYVTSTIKEKNEHYSYDVANGVIPEAMNVEYNETVYELKLVSDKYENPSDSLCPLVTYADAKTSIRLKVDSETLGDKRWYLYAGSLSFYLHQIDSEPEKNSDEILAIARNYLKSHLTLNFEDYGYRIVEKVTYQEPYFTVCFFLENRLMQQVCFAFFYISSHGYITIADIVGWKLYEFEAYNKVLLDFIENAFLEEITNRVRAKGCECELNVLYKILYYGKQYVIVECDISPDKQGTESHPHDYKDYSYYVFFEIKESPD